MTLATGVELDPTVYSRLINRPVYHEAAFAIFLVADLDAIGPMYPDHSVPFALLEAGYMGQLLMTESTDLGLGLCPVGDLAFDRIRQLFELEERHVLVHSLLGGEVDAEAIVPERGAPIDEQRAARTLRRVQGLSTAEAQALLRAHDDELPNGPRRR